ncbi:hypothetical protein ACE1TH_11400 [Shouchella sp. JSM 1781072]
MKKWFSLTLLSLVLFSISPTIYNDYSNETILSTHSKADHGH